MKEKGEPSCVRTRSDKGDRNVANLGFLLLLLRFVKLQLKY